MQEKGRKRLLKFLGAVLIVLALSITWLRSDWGRSWVQERVRDWLREGYQISLQYESLQVKPTSFGWQLTFRDLLWGYQVATPTEPIRELTMDVNPWGFFVGAHPLSAIRIKGSSLYVRLAPDALSLESMGLKREAQDLGQLLTRFKAKTPGKMPSLPDISLEDVHLDLAYQIGTEAQLLHLSFAVNWSREQGLSRLDLTSPGFEFVELTQQLLAFARHSTLLTDTSAFDSVQRFLQGRMGALQLQCATLQTCQGSGSLQNLAWKNQGWIPGVQDFSAHFDFKGRALTLDLPAGSHTLTWSPVYQRPVQIEREKTRINLQYDASKLHIEVPETSLVWNGVRSSAQAKIDVPLDKPAKTRLELAVKAKYALWSSVRNALPDQFFSSNLNQWLAQRIQGGYIHSMEATLAGQILEFPFARSQTGSFKLQSGFAGVSLQYLDDWPRLDSCRGQFQMQQAKLDVRDIQCRAMGVENISGHLEIPQLTGKDREIRSQIKVRSPFPSAVAFLAKTPLRSLGVLIPSIAAETGLQETDVQFRFLLGQSQVRQSLELSGRTRIEGARLSLPQALYTGAMDRIDLQFDQNGLKDLDGVAVNSEDKTRIRVLRNTDQNALDLSLEALDNHPNALQGRVRFTPADTPQTAEGSLAGLKLGGGAALVTLDRILWNGGQKALLSFKGQAQVKDFGAVSPSLGLSDDYKGGHGTIGFDLSFPGIPGSGLGKSLTGDIAFDLAEGSLQQLPNTVVSLINVANLKIFGVRADSLSYAFFRGKLNFANGALRTKDTSIGLGVIEVRGLGTIDYASSSMDLNLQIIPDLGSPAVSVAIGLWNPLAGLSLFGLSKLQDKASDSRLNRLLSQTYKLKGKISDPTITLIRPMDFNELFK